MAWNEAVVTNAGMNLLSESLLSGNVVITKTVGGESCCESTALLAQTEIIGPKHVLNIAKIDISDSKITVNIKVQNQELEESYILRQIGLFAKLDTSDNEILFAIIQDKNGEIIPTESENPEFLVEFDFVMPVSNTDNINIVVTPNTFATVEDINNTMKALGTEISAREQADGALQTELDDKANLSYCTCGTTAGTSAKTATVAAGNFALITGAAVDVKFAIANTASTPTLNVNNTGAKYIKKYGATAPSAYMWQAGAVVRFVYDGTYWIMQNGTTATNTYYGVTKLNTAVNSTSTSEAATPSAVKQAYDKANAAIPKAQIAVPNGVASLGTDGKVPPEQIPDRLVQRTCRFVVGTSTAGWTATDVDYLCDGTADDVKINAAIRALPSTGGEIVILDGEYSITSAILLNKDGVSLVGNGHSTVLRKMKDGSVTGINSVVRVESSGNMIKDLNIDGNKDTYSSSSSGILLYNSSNTIVTCISSTNNTANGIYMTGGFNNIISESDCSNNDNMGIAISNSKNNMTTGNKCYDNSNYGISIGTNSNCNRIENNHCYNNAYGINLSANSDNIVACNICDSNSEDGIRVYENAVNQIIANNTCITNRFGIFVFKNSNITLNGNTCNYNSTDGIRMYSGQDNCRITGNTCSNNNNNGMQVYVVNTVIDGNTCNYNNAHGIDMYESANSTMTSNTCNNNVRYGMYMYGCTNNSVVGNTCIRGTGLPEDYTEAQYTIRIEHSKSKGNLIAYNNIMGKNYINLGGTENLFVDNKYN